MKVIEFKHIGKQYRLGTVSTGTFSHDLNRWWMMKILGRQDPYLKIGEANVRSKKGDSDFVLPSDFDFEAHKELVPMQPGDGYLSSYLLETECYPYEGDVFFVTDYINTTGWTFGDREMEQSIIPYALYYRQLMKDPFFVQRLREKWTNYKSIWEQRIPSFIDEQYGNIRRAALRNETMYTNMYTKNEEVLIRATQCDGRENFRE